MTNLVLGDLILESLTPSVNASLCNLGPEGFICIYPGYIVDGSLPTGVEFNLRV
jgi:hypothetical protein